MRPDRRRARLAPPPPPDDDQTGWLLTFSDLVLQLFGFALVVGVLGRAVAPAAASHPGPEPSTPVAAAPPSAPERLPLEMVDDAFGVRPEPEPSAPEPQVEPARVAATEPVPPTVAPPEPESPHLAAAARALEALAAGRDAVTVTLRSSDVVLTLGDAIVFPSGSAELLPTANPILHDVQRIASGMPDVGIEVTGHTDDVPIHTAQFPSNLELSLARAARVARELGVGDPALLERTTASGVGPYRPVASNADAAGRERNRRVEIRLVPRG